MGVEENKAVVRRIIEEFVNNGDATVTKEVWKSDITYHDNKRLIEGSDGLRDFVLAWRSACPDFHVTIDNLIGEEDYLSMRYTVQGIFQNEVFGITPTGKELEYIADELIQFNDGKVVEIWAICDELDLFKQLGVIPSN